MFQAQIPSSTGLSLKALLIPIILSSSSSPSSLNLGLLSMYGEYMLLPAALPKERNKRLSSRKKNHNFRYISLQLSTFFFMLLRNIYINSARGEHENNNKAHTAVLRFSAKRSESPHHQTNSTVKNRKFFVFFIFLLLLLDLDQHHHHHSGGSAPITVD